MVTGQRAPARTPRAIVAWDRRRGEIRVATVSLALAAVCFAVLCVSLSFGEVDVPVAEVARSLLGGGDEGIRYIVNELRLPRALVAVMAGAAFGLSGAIFQTLLRNPLASPDIIGITAGASAAAVIALLILGLSGFGVAFAAFAGALATAFVMYGFAWRAGVSGYRLVLVGVALAAMLTAVVSYCLTRADVYEAREALVWLTGSLNAKTWTTVSVLAPSVAVLIPLALLGGRWLAALRLGDDTARGLGVPVQRARLVLLVVAVALAAAATAAVGPVAFVAFVAGPIARRLTRENGVSLLPAALVGALVLTAADLVAQQALESVRFPVGVVTSIIGGPYLLWLLANTNRIGRGG